MINRWFFRQGTRALECSAPVLRTSRVHRMEAGSVKAADHVSAAAARA
jgi:hypothetical protein